MEGEPTVDLIGIGGEPDISLVGLGDNATEVTQAGVGGDVAIDDRDPNGATWNLSRGVSSTRRLYLTPLNLLAMDSATVDPSLTWSIRKSGRAEAFSLDAILMTVKL